MHAFMRQALVGLLLVTVGFMTANVTPTALPRGNSQQISVEGAILGLAIIAGIIYLVTQDQQGVYHRYPYGQYYPSGPHYRYQGPYSVRYGAYQNRFYGGPLPGQWSGNQGRMNWYDSHQGWAARCAPQANNYGQWGRQRQWDGWCQQNLRFREVRPDQLWQRYNPWDTGTANDHVGGGH